MGAQLYICLYITNYCSCCRNRYLGSAADLDHHVASVLWP